MKARRIALVVVLALLAALAWWARSTQHRKVELVGYSHWISTDPDSLHQLRRIERIFREGPPAAEFDATFNWPDGSAIPAPPFYPLVAWAVLAPFAPAERAARRGWLEEAACTLPALFAVLAVLVLALAAHERIGVGAAVFAGVCLAVAPGAIHYSCIGNGDYQSWSLLLGLAQLALLSSALARGWLERTSTAWISGALLGVLHGVAIGSWTPALIQLVLADVVLAFGLILHTRRGECLKLPEFGVGLHVAALLVLAPALATSPWRTSAPWQIVNLSWFHALYLVLGSLVFAPLFALRTPSTLRRSYGALTAAVLLALFGAAWLAPVGPGEALREAFSWARAENTFMAQVAESTPLWGAWSKLALYLGYGAFVAPLACVALAVIAWRERALAWAPWCVALAVFGVMAAAQMRFAELVVAPLALALALCASRLFARVRFPTAARWLATPLAALAALGLHYDGVSSTVRRARSDPPFTDSLAKRSSRRMADWLRENSPEGSGVMALWGQGQTIQWAAERGVVASNYGHYVGEESFLDSFRFFAGDDAAQAEALLARRRVDYVLVTSDFERQWSSIAAGAGVSNTAERLARSMGARLLGAGAPLEFLRVVHASPLVDPRRGPPGAPPGMPSGFVLERVSGAWIEARGSPGALLEFEAELRLRGQRLRYSTSARAEADGRVRVRTPYASERVGDLEPAAGFRARFDGREHVLAVREADVRSGATITLP